MITPIQANIVGFNGHPCSLFSALDTEAGILMISVEAKNYTRTRFKDSALITNDPNIDRDCWFDMADFAAAIRAFYALREARTEDGSRQLCFDTKASRADPISNIERDGFDESGPRYRISEGISNVQVATLATCFYANRAKSINATLHMASELARLASGEILTI